MKKRIFIILSCTMITVALLSVSMQIVQKNEAKAKQKALTATMPVSNSLKGLKENTPSVFIAFHPECEHCQYEAKSINERRTNLARVNIVMFTVANDSLTKVFSKQYGLDSLKNVHVIADTTREMERLFDVKTIPTIFIYNAQNLLVKRYNGETKIEAILKILGLNSSN
jgi:thioredoxin-related protein